MPPIFLCGDSYLQALPTSQEKKHRVKYRKKKSNQGRKHRGSFIYSMRHLASVQMASNSLFGSIVHVHIALRWTAISPSPSMAWINYQSLFCLTKTTHKESYDEANKITQHIFVVFFLLVHYKSPKKNSLIESSGQWEHKTWPFGYDIY